MNSGMNHRNFLEYFTEKCNFLLFADMSMSKTSKPVLKSTASSFPLANDAFSTLRLILIDGSTPQFGGYNKFLN